MGPSPYVDVKVDFQLSDEDVTIRSATAVAQAARSRVLAALHGVVRDIDIDLELIEATEKDYDSASGAGVQSVGMQAAGMPLAADLGIQMSSASSILDACQA